MRGEKEQVMYSRQNVSFHFSRVERASYTSQIKEWANPQNREFAPSSKRKEYYILGRDMGNTQNRKTWPLPL